MANSHEHEHKHSHHHDQPEHCGPVHFLLNRHPKESLDHTLTGHQLKELAGVPDADELFLETDCGDELVPTEATVLVRDGDRFHTMPSPQYGRGLAAAAQEQIDEVLSAYVGEVKPAGEGAHLILRQQQIPDGFLPKVVDILIKIPALLPEASPDMFWVNPPLALASGAQPQSTSLENIDGVVWQRFSWHLPPNSWHAGTSRLRDFVRAVLARLHKVG